MAATTMMIVTYLVMGAGLLVTFPLCLRLANVRRSIGQLRERARTLAPYLVVIGLMIVVKGQLHDPSVALSKQIDWDITPLLFAVEGYFVAGLQDVTPNLTYPMFSALYMFAYPYLLFVPVVMYFVLPSLRRFKELLVAYTINYAVGFTCYTLFVAYGPRYHLYSVVEQPMYDMYPQTQDLTAEVSANTNVFPSLHASLTVVVMLFAWQARDSYPRWFWISWVLGVGVLLSTMVLGIHWLVDVIAGIVLAVGSVKLASWVVSKDEGPTRQQRWDQSEETAGRVSSDVGD
jgi:membrane-associated phospholipid phosphatase